MLIVAQHKRLFLKKK